MDFCGDVCYTLINDLEVKLIARQYFFADDTKLIRVVKSRADCG